MTATAKYSIHNSAHEFAKTYFNLLLTKMTKHIDLQTTKKNLSRAELQNGFTLLSISQLLTFYLIFKLFFTLTL
jgi:hypothetical protein